MNKFLKVLRKVFLFFITITAIYAGFEMLLTDVDPHPMSTFNLCILVLLTYKLDI